MTILILFIILFTLITQLFIFTGALHLFAKFFKVENLRFKTTLKIFSIYTVTVIAGFIFVNIVDNYTLYNLDNSALGIILKIIIALFIFFIDFSIFYYFLYWFFKKYYQTDWKIFIKIFVLFIVFGSAYSYFIANPAVNYVRLNLFEPFLVISESMEPNVVIDDYLVVKKFNNQYQRGDIVLARGLVVGLNGDYIKRIRGLPNEQIQIKDGKILINNQILIERYILKEKHSVILI